MRCLQGDKSYSYKTRSSFPKISSFIILYLQLEIVACSRLSDSRDDASVRDLEKRDGGGKREAALLLPVSSRFIFVVADGAFCIVRRFYYDGAWNRL